MGPRPIDFDEDLVRRSPTFLKWETLAEGAKLRYACREFSKGRGKDEERLMRRIMIARRNNVRDHETLKKARGFQSMPSSSTPSGDPLQSQPFKAEENRDNRKRKLQEGANDGSSKKGKGMGDEEGKRAGDNIINSVASKPRDLSPQEQKEKPPSQCPNRRATTLISNEVIGIDMDVDAVIATRSYRTWVDLADGAELIYNQKYIKGAKDHDWLLRKNIWRRMRYRRENKQLVKDMIRKERGGQQKSSKQRSNPPIRQRNNSRSQQLSEVNEDSKTNPSSVVTISNENNIDQQEASVSVASEIVDHALSSTNSATGIVVASTGADSHNNTVTISSMIGDHDHLAAAASIALVGTGVDGDDEDNTNAIEAAVAAAESYAKIATSTSTADATPWDAKALEAAARLAATANVVDTTTAVAATAAIDNADNKTDSNVGTVEV